MIAEVVNNIVDNIAELMDNQNTYNEMSFAHNPYGDGDASQRILKSVLKRYS